MKTIFITEKPSVAQEYRKILKVQTAGKTDGYVEGYSSVLKKDVIITWAVGHLIGICTPEEQNEEWGGRWSLEHLPMIPKNFKYQPNEGTLKQFKIVESLYTRKDIEAIYYAGDSGREGIYIQALIRNQIFKTPPKFEERVVWIDNTTEEAILKGIKTAKPYASYQPMIDSGYARAIADWLIGMNFTEGFTLTSGKLINTGRVMTPTLAMIVNRQKEIDEFVKTIFYGIKADEKIFWKAVKGSRFFESDLLYNENGFLKKDDAEVLCSEMNEDKKLTVENVKVQEKTEYAPYLFNLADLQAYCSKRFKISPAQTLEIAQSLYEKKFTTYPRTDCRFLSSAVADELRSKGMNIPKRYVDDSKVTDHYAIIPTFHGNAESLSGLEAQVYQGILKRFNDTMKLPYVYDTVSVTYIHKCGERFFENFRKVKQLGFKESDEEKNAFDEEYIGDKAMPVKGNTVSVKNFEIRDMETNPPSAYTTGSLMLAMEKAGKLIEDEELREQIKTCGIGTSATRADIIEKLEKKGFITVDKKQKVAPTEFGKAVVPIVAAYDEALVSPVKTADMEAKLNAIAARELSLDEYIKEIDEYVAETTKKIVADNKTRLSSFNNSNTSDKAYKCPKCSGEVIKGKFGWYCKKKCGMNISKVYGHELTDAQISKLFDGKEVTYTANGRKTTVTPEIVQNDYQGKTYYNWKTTSAFTKSAKKLSSKSSGKPSRWK